MNKLPLDGLIVLELSQYLSGPSAGLRLADLGARVIKIERPGTGDACRQLAIKNLWAEDNSLLFHTINRNKESFAANLKDKEDLELVKQLIAKADVLTHNFRPGVMEGIGLDYQSLQSINPRLIYAEISGYGKQGPWKNKPGQDLLLQSMSGLMYTTGNGDKDPMPFGLSISDMLCGAQLVQGTLAALIRRHKTGRGANISISLMETLLDFQFELLTTYYNSGQLPQRSAINNGHPLLSAPYGVYRTAKGFLAIAMTDLAVLAHALECEDLRKYSAKDAFAARDEIKKIIAAHVGTRPAAFWLEKLQAQDIWAMEVYNWQQMTEQEGYQRLEMEQTIRTEAGTSIRTTRCPIRINGEKLFSSKPAPALGAHNTIIYNDLLNKK